MTNTAGGHLEKCIERYQWLKCSDDSAAAIYATTDSHSPTQNFAWIFIGGIYIKYGDKEEWLLPADSGRKKFDWLDVREPDSKCVIDPLGAYLMLVKPVVPDNLCTDPPAGDNQAYHCARNRSVHTDVESKYLMTYWSGADSYTVNSGETTQKTILLSDGTEWGSTHSESHVSYTFELEQEVVVDRWLNGCHEETYTGVTEIRILYHDPPTYHLGFPHVPMNGGRG